MAEGMGSGAGVVMAAGWAEGEGVTIATGIAVGTGTAVGTGLRRRRGGGICRDVPAVRAGEMPDHEYKKEQASRRGDQLLPVLEQEWNHGRLAGGGLWRRWRLSVRRCGGFRRRGRLARARRQPGNQ